MFEDFLHANADKDMLRLGLLLEKFCSNLNIDTCDMHENTLLSIAVTLNNPTFLQMVLDKGASMNLRDKNENTPLMTSTMLEFFEVSKVLINAGADLNVQNNLGHTPLMWHAIHGYTDMVYLLLNKGADISITDVKGRTALDNAERFNKQECADVIKQFMELRGVT